ncbi:hypothetical protein BGZ82_006942 [Podila clonocystis]|nr:hypothetical protein BGZ82_006942 [Podila clonocystis]
MTTLDHNMLQLSAFQYSQSHPLTQSSQSLDAFNAAAILDDCCHINNDIDNFCCATVEPSTCCGPHAHSQISMESLECCSSPRSPLAPNGYAVTDAECCAIEAAKDGLETDCCQELTPVGAALAAPPTPTCCAEHPEVSNDCCLTCCPDTLTPSPGSPATRSSSVSTLSATTPNMPTHTHYFQTQQPCSSTGDGWNVANMCNQLDHSHSHSTHSAFHFMNNTMVNDMHGTESSSGTPSVASLPLSPEQMSEAQIDHMIRCLWSGCSAEFMSEDDLLPHVSQLHMPNPDINHPLCLWESCETEQLDTSKLLQHLLAEHHIMQNIDNLNMPTPQTTTKEQHQCHWKGCNKSFPNFDSLTSHLSEDHIGTGKSEYVCEWEGCERNGRGFGQRQKAMRHIQTHTGDKPYQCQRCRKRFSEANIMAQHMRTHTGEKPYKCPEPGCGREFSISGALTIHLRVHTGEKPFKCKFEGCDKWFSESSNLTKHLRVHTGERPFSCDFPGCTKRFSRPDQVTRHKRTHLSPEEKKAAKSQQAKSEKRASSPRFDPLK